MKRYLFPVILIILAIAGFFISSYLTILHYQDAFPPCTIAGCERVLTSSYATLYSIPIALGGTIYFLVLLVLLGLSLQGFRWAVILARVAVTVSLIASIYLVYLQAAVIGAFCQWCLTVEVINLLLFVGVWRESSRS